MILTDDGLPGFWKDADAASLRGQTWTVRYAGARLFGVLVGAAGGLVSWEQGRVNLAAAIVALGFLIALASELVSWIHQPERDWYSGRALAESAKTLAWRYSVCADPFPPSISQAEACEILRRRLREVSEEASDRLTIASSDAVVTAEMNSLRASSFATRKDAYIAGRTEKQRAWYAAKARANRIASIWWRAILILSEVIAFGLAALRIFDGWSVDYAGLLAAMIAGGAAWVGLRQYSPLASAYTTATRELALQVDNLRAKCEAEWPLAAADAEEAISREHTTWLASRLGSRGSRWH